MKGTEPFSRLRSFQHPFKPFVAVEQWLPKGKLRPEGGCYIIIRFAFKITLVLRLAFGPSLGHEIWPLLRGPSQYADADQLKGRTPSVKSSDPWKQPGDTHLPNIQKPELPKGKTPPIKSTVHQS